MPLKKKVILSAEKGKNASRGYYQTCNPIHKMNKNRKNRTHPCKTTAKCQNL